MHHARHRRAFGRPLIEQPLMRNVLADLALESEAATFWPCGWRARFDEDDQPFARLAFAVGKYWLSKRTPPHVAEALECLGGNGFVEECILPRLYREAPLNSIWEGSGNVIALDVLRASEKEPESAGTGACGDPAGARSADRAVLWTAYAADLTESRRTAGSRAAGAGAAGIVAGTLQPARRGGRVLRIAFVRAGQDGRSARCRRRPISMRCWASRDWRQQLRNADWVRYSKKVRTPCAHSSAG